MQIDRKTEEFKKFLKRRTVCLPIIFFLGIFIGWLLFARHGVRRIITYDNPPLRSHDSQYKFIDPLYACGALNNERFEEFRPLKAELEELINERLYSKSAKAVSVYFRDLDKGRRLSINVDEKYFPASLLKVPVMIAYFKLAESDPALLSRSFMYDGSFDDNAKEDIKPKIAVSVGSHSVDELIKAMIVYSDNNATRLLFDHLDKNVLNSIYNDLDFDAPQGGALDVSSVKSYAYFFRVLYNGTYLSKGMSEKALTLLSQSDFADGLRAGAPKNVVVSEKFGESTIYKNENTIDSREFHDCGIVYHRKSRYLLCVMTKGDNFGSLKSVVRDISEKVYNKVSSAGY